MAGFTITSPFTAWEVQDVNPGDYFARLFVMSDGTVVPEVFDTLGGTAGSGNWGAPTTPGIGAGYFVRFTVTEDGATGGDNVVNEASTFTSLSADRKIEINGSGTGGYLVFTIEIATDSGGSNIVLTSAGNIVRNVP